MITSDPLEDSSFFNALVKPLGKNEIELVKKASRAFAVSYVNEIYNTLKSLDPSDLDKFEITKQYPYNFYLFIHQKKPGEIEQLDIYSEQKYYGEGLCEVKAIYHNSEYDASYLEERRRFLNKRCTKWRLPCLEISKMNMTAKHAGKRVGKSIHNLVNILHKVPKPKQSSSPNVGFPLTCQKSVNH